MGSSINGVSKSVTWQDYTIKKMAPPSDDTDVDVASTAAAWSMPGGFNILADTSTKPPTYKLADAITINVDIDSDNSWVADWIFSKWTHAKQDAILNHEQGHYNIVALLARDYFMELMAMMGKTYKTAPAGTLDAQAITKRYTGAIVKALQDLYDSPSETNHDPIGNADAQKKWDGFFADAVSKKTPLMTILSGGGIKVPTQPKSPVTVTVPYP